MNKLYFTKMEGLGNDFVLIDDRENKFLNKENDLALKLCHRNFGVGADGVIFVRNSNKAFIKMIIYNADGSHATMCGNGIRCFAKYVYDKKIVNKDFLLIETDDGIKEATLFIENKEVKEVEINMGTWSFDPLSIPITSEEPIINKPMEINKKLYNITSLHMGVPHTVIYTEFSKLNIKEGKNIEKINLFPMGTNVNFCEKIDFKTIKVKTWERGAGATLACGTGSCASVVVGNILGLIDNEVKVYVPGGVMSIRIKNKEVYMKGPSKIVFEGSIF